MKPRHQIKFKRRHQSVPNPTKKIREKAIVKDSARKSSSVIKASVQVGERQLHFARALSDTEKAVRDASLASLREWLTTNANALETSQWDNLWKGLFYCIWMADKPRLITAVIQNVVNLADVGGWPFLAALFNCLMREWFGIDRHRIDKYYELVTAALRKCLSMVLAATSKTQLTESTKIFTAMLQENVWNNLRNGGLGLALHVLDVYVDIVFRPVLVCAKQLQSKNEEFITLYNIMLADVLKLISPERPNQPALHIRIRERILMQLIPLVTNEEINLDKFVQRDIIGSVAERLFAIAADKRTSDRERKPLYDLQGAMKAFVLECDEQMPSTAEGEAVEPPECLEIEKNENE